MNELLVRKWMLDNTSDYIDPKTGELNCTLLATDCVADLGCYVGEFEDEIPEQVFEIAAEFAK